jgi:purine-nucleoside/S-methyl-5'-thioadenosine phosphorylase / adenosine deaminase
MMSMTVPQPSDGFEWVQAPHGPVLRCTPLERYAHHFFTAGSLRLREDDREWNAVSALAGVRRDDLRLLRQVHGRTVVAVEADDDAAATPPEADAAITRSRRVALVVRVADCAPILIADRVTGAVAAVHAGWRSTMQRIVEATVASMHANFGTRPADLVAAIGPSLGQCCGEMGEEVLDAFRVAGHDDDSIEQWFHRQAGRRPHFDLWRANRAQLERSGVPADDIHVSGLCTRTYPDHFHSYRAAGSNAGRMAGVIRANH